jgi:hypothetical protein
MKTSLKSVLLVVLVGLLASNAMAAWTLSSNPVTNTPESPWSYLTCHWGGANPSILNPSDPVQTSAQTNLLGVTGQNGAGYTDSYGSVGIFAKAIANNVDGLTDIHAGDVFTYNNFSAGTMLGFTSPVTAHLTISGKVWSAKAGGANGDVWFFEGTGWDGIVVPSTVTSSAGLHSPGRAPIGAVTDATSRANALVFPTIQFDAVQGQMYTFFFGGGGGAVPSRYMGVDITITPEPMTMSLLALGSLAVLRRRRK